MRCLVHSSGSTRERSGVAPSYEDHEMPTDQSGLQKKAKQNRALKLGHKTRRMICLTTPLVTYGLIN